MQDDDLERGVNDGGGSQVHPNLLNSLFGMWPASDNAVSNALAWFRSLEYYRQFMIYFLPIYNNDGAAYALHRYIKALVHEHYSLFLILTISSLDKDAFDGRRPNVFCNESGAYLRSQAKASVFDMELVIRDMGTAACFVMTVTFAPLLLLSRDRNAVAYTSLTWSRVCSFLAPPFVIMSPAIGSPQLFLCMSFGIVYAIVLLFVTGSPTFVLLVTGSVLVIIPHVEFLIVLLSATCSWVHRALSRSNQHPISLFVGSYLYECEQWRIPELQLLTMDEANFMMIKSMCSTLERVRNEGTLERLHIEWIRMPHWWFEPVVHPITGTDVQGDLIFLNAISFYGAPMTVLVASHVPIDHGATAAILLGRICVRGHVVTLAVKVLTERAGAQQLESLGREIWAAGQLAQRPWHPFILPFICHATCGAQPAIISLYSKNGNLLQYFKRSVGSVDKRNLMLQVADAVAYLHTVVGLVHGDLKCENVLVSNTKHALLADFGLSTSVEKEENAADTSTDARILCTVNFAAPEILVDTATHADRVRSKTTESDVYAFGMLVLQAVTERLPWGNDNQPSITTSVHNGKRPMRPTTGFSDAWWNVCVKCWSPEPAERPAMEAVDYCDRCMICKWMCSISVSFR